MNAEWKSLRKRKSMRKENLESNNNKNQNRNRNRIPGSTYSQNKIRLPSTESEQKPKTRNRNRHRIIIEVQVQSDGGIMSERSFPQMTEIRGKGAWGGRFCLHALWAHERDTYQVIRSVTFESKNESGRMGKRSAEASRLLASGLILCHPLPPLLWKTNSIFTQATHSRAAAASPPPAPLPCSPPLHQCLAKTLNQTQPRKKTHALPFPSRLRSTRCTNIYTFGTTRKNSILLRGSIVNRSYGTHKSLYISLYLVLHTMAPRNTYVEHSAL